MSRSVVGLLLDNAEGNNMVRQACIAKGFSFSEFQELVQAEVEQIGEKRRTALFDSFDDILDRIKIDE